MNYYFLLLTLCKFIYIFARLFGNILLIFGALSTRAAVLTPEWMIFKRLSYGK